MKLGVELSTVVHNDPPTTVAGETKVDAPAISISSGNSLVTRMPQMGDYVLSKRAAEILRSIREDLRNDCVVHCHNLFPHAFLGKELEKRRASFVTTIHGTTRGELQRFRKERPMHFRELTYRLGCYYGYNAGFRSLLKRSRSHFIALSAVNAADFMRQGIPASRVHIIPNGADLEVYRPSDSFEAREQLGLPADRSVILTICGIQPRKGLHVLVKAANAIVRESPEAYFVIVGEVTSDVRWYMSYLRRLLAKFALSDHFKFTGFVAKKDLPLYVNAADLFVLPSYAEGAPLVIPNAMACGCPVVATESSSAGYVPKNLTVSDGDHAELAQKISFLLQNPKERRSVGEQMREKAVNELSWAKIARRIYAVYEKIASDNSARA
jgi:glycosyltransferase involved in cell wall biosynthesis